MSSKNFFATIELVLDEGFEVPPPPYYDNVAPGIILETVYDVRRAWGYGSGSSGSRGYGARSSGHYDDLEMNIGSSNNKHEASGISRSPPSRCQEDEEASMVDNSSLEQTSGKDSSTMDVHKGTSDGKNNQDSSKSTAGCDSKNVFNEKENKPSGSHANGLNKFGSLFGKGKIKKVKKSEGRNKDKEYFRKLLSNGGNGQLQWFEMLLKEHEKRFQSRIDLFNDGYRGKTLRKLGGPKNYTLDDFFMMAVEKIPY